MIAIVDYGAGNSASVLQALTHLGHRAEVTSDSGLVARAERVIFPGVGAAGAAMASLRRLDLLGALRERIAADRPFLGICLGYQLLFRFSHEDKTECLGALPGEVVRFPDDLREVADGRRLKVPQIGWNRVEFAGSHPLWRGIDSGGEFYFVHSYYPRPETAPGMTLMHTEYGLRFASGVVRGALCACQFHPEKSGRLGLRLLDNFCR